jgi:hydroxyacylglutathione hydrolase
LNEVGRPDLAVKTDLTAKDLAEMLYDSIQKFRSLDDSVRIYPGHGSGSACGKSIGAGDFC